ncbi:RibD family protein [Nocardioides daeguensis]|uniref:Bacterial bifunctional deaminase-reductase C-terminal domain-containing protein n=1 Tax=Nocardioides daeguensis TaxID=908359 RepID=A0ABP6VCD6_9ACTN|nr:dihydrofolate reductase family protein [Nocardioides daeguensis]MBV6729470.1 dihydrofolate reductase family protein [Nocardioides daeguensis]MCR1771757.1 dihydrofolate reductase family protein [Nocardioides daeguensis]
MGERPYVLLSCCISLDGYLDSGGEERLLLSNDADFDRVDEVRAGCDAILVGAATVRNDDPRLQVRSAQRRARRVAEGRPAGPLKVTLTSRGDLAPDARFFTVGDGEKLVYCPDATVPVLESRVGARAEVVALGDEVRMADLVADLGARGVRRLMVEGGGRVHTQFLAAGIADELQLVVAPFFVGDSRARRFVGDGEFPWRAGRRAELVESRAIGDVALLRYALSDRFQA